MSVLNRSRVLVAEDEALVALNLASSIEEANGVAVGPVATVGEGLALVAREGVHAAILDIRLGDMPVTPLAVALLEESAIVLFHTASPIPLELTARFGDLARCEKPMASERVILRLAGLLRQPS